VTESEKKLLFHKDALSGVPRQHAQRIVDKARWLWTNRRAVSHDSLGRNLSGFYKRRLGKYRIIYTYDDECDEMVIRLVGTRDEIYKTLS
jgi:mRNA-degrading endonuclease RelE of RelBE toxin-antitoxin system